MRFIHSLLPSERGQGGLWSQPMAHSFWRARGLSCAVGYDSLDLTQISNEVQRRLRRKISGKGAVHVESGRAVVVLAWIAKAFNAVSIVGSTAIA